MKLDGKDVSLHPNNPRSLSMFFYLYGFLHLFLHQVCGMKVIQKKRVTHLMSISLSLPVFSILVYCIELIVGRNGQGRE